MQDKDESKPVLIGTLLFGISVLAKRVNAMYAGLVLVTLVNLFLAATLAYAIVSAWGCAR